MANIGVNFECPSDYTEENICSQLYYEDLDDDSELWLIRVPSHIQLTEIDRKKIVLSDQSNLSKIKTEKGQILDFYSEKCETPNFSLVLPLKDNSSLKEVKQTFSGSIYITEGLSFKDESVVKCEEYEQEISMNEATNLNEIPNSASRSSKKKAKKKRKKSVSHEDLHYETDDASHLISRNEQYFHSGRERNESVLTKNDSSLSNLDEFPSCKSQV